MRAMLATGLHVMAMAFLRTMPPLLAKRRLDALGARLPELSAKEARRTLKFLRGGTCLSRSLALSARMPRAHVVIGGVRPRRGAFEAHAWVENDGEVLFEGGSHKVLAKIGWMGEALGVDGGE